MGISGAFLGLPYRILNRGHKKELYLGVYTGISGGVDKGEGLGLDPEALRIEGRTYNGLHVGIFATIRFSALRVSLLR